VPLGQRGNPDIAVSETTRISGAVAFGAGAIVAVQGRINGELGQVTDDGVLAALVNFSVGLAALAVFVLARPTTRSALRELPKQLRIRDIPWWTMLGGLAGACFVAAQGITVSALGVALFTVATVAGQTGMSLAVDRWGLGPTGMLPVSVLRVLAALLGTVAVAVAASGRPTESGDGTAALVLLALLAGAAVAFQAAFNGRLSVATGQPTVAALVNFCVGLTALIGVLVIERALRSDIHGTLPNFGERPWLYSGGLMGVIFVVSAAWSVRALGVLLFSLFVIAGSLVGALLVDLVAPTPGASFTWELVTGVVMTFGAVGLASARRRTRAPWQDPGL
jgi:transporter family-2 protein